MEGGKTNSIKKMNYKRKNLNSNLEEINLGKKEIINAYSVKFCYNLLLMMTL